MTWLYVVSFILALLAGAGFTLALMLWERLDDAKRVLHDWQRLYAESTQERADLLNRLMYAMEKPWMDTALTDTGPDEPPLFVLPDPGPEYEETWPS